MVETIIELMCHKNKLGFNAYKVLKLPFYYNISNNTKVAWVKKPHEPLSFIYLFRTKELRGRLANISVKSKREDVTAGNRTAALHIPCLYPSKSHDLIIPCRYPVMTVVTNSVHRAIEGSMRGRFRLLRKLRRS